MNLNIQFKDPLPTIFKRIILGIVFGGFWGILEIGFFESDLIHFWAAFFSGSIFAVFLGVWGPLFKQKWKILFLSGFSGSLAGLVWWVIVNNDVISLATPLIIGMLFGLISGLEIFNSKKVRKNN